MSVAPATALERAHSAAKERELAGPTLAAYRRTWLKLVAWTTASGFDLGSLPREAARGYYEDLTGNRSASHHLQVKAGIAFLYKVLDKPNPFRDCLAPRFRPDAQEIKFLEASDLAKVLLALRVTWARTTLGGWPRIWRKRSFLRPAGSMNGRYFPSRTRHQPIEFS
jgi:hypothetical protein